MFKQSRVMETRPRLKLSTFNICVYIACFCTSVSRPYKSVVHNNKVAVVPYVCFFQYWHLAPVSAAAQDTGVWPNHTQMSVCILWTLQTTWSQSQNNERRLCELSEQHGVNHKTMEEDYVNSPNNMESITKQWKKTMWTFRTTWSQSQNNERRLCELSKLHGVNHKTMNEDYVNSPNNM